MWRNALFTLSRNQYGANDLVPDVAAQVSNGVTFEPVGERELNDLDGSWVRYEVR